MTVAAIAGKSHCWRGWLGRGQHLLLGLIAVTGLASVGCATRQAPDPPPLTSVARQVVETFSLTGRISIRVDDRLDSLRVEWDRDEVRETLKLYTPFGSQVAEIVSTAGQVTLRRGDEVEYATSVGALTQSLLGVFIDTAVLARWVQGVELEAAEHMTGPLKPSGWKVAAENLRPVVGYPGVSVAGRVVATNAQTTLRIVIDVFQPRSSADRSKGR